MNQPVENTSGGKNWIKVVIAIIVVVMIIGLAWYFLKKPSSNSSSKWQTYSDATFNFSVKFPPDTSVTTKEAKGFTVSFPDANSTKYLKQISVSRDTNTLAATVELAKKGIPQGSEIASTSNITVNNQPAVKWLLKKSGSDTSQEIMIFVVKNSLLYVIGSNTTDTNFDTFLSSFQFSS